MDSSSVNSTGIPIAAYIETDAHRPKAEDILGRSGEQRKGTAKEQGLPTFIHETAHNQSVKDAKLESAGVATLRGGALTLEETVKADSLRNVSFFNKERIQLDVYPHTEEMHKNMLEIADVMNNERFIAAQAAFAFEATLMGGGILYDKLTAAARGEIRDPNDMIIFSNAKEKGIGPVATFRSPFSTTSTETEEVPTTSSTDAVGGAPITFRSLLDDIAVLIGTQNELVATAQEVQLEQSSLAVKSSVDAAKSIKKGADKSLTPGIIGFSISVTSSAYSLYGMRQSAAASQEVTPGMVETNSAITKTQDAIKSSQIAFKSNSTPDRLKANEDIIAARKALNEPGVDEGVKKAGLRELELIEQSQDPNSAWSAVNNAAKSSEQAATSAKLAAEAKKNQDSDAGLLEREASDHLTKAQTDYEAAEKQLQALPEDSYVKKSGTESLARIKSANDGSIEALGNPDNPPKPEIAEASALQAKSQQVNQEKVLDSADKGMDKARKHYKALTIKAQNEAFQHSNIKYNVIAGVGNSAGSLFSQALSNYYSSVGQAEQKMAEADATLYKAATDAMDQTIQTSLQQSSSIRDTMNAIMAAQSQIVRDTAA